MIKRLKGRENLIKFFLLLVIAFGIYLIVAWASYSPLDNSWSVASSLTDQTLNKAGTLGAWEIDILFSMFGKIAFLVPLGLTFVPIYLLVTRESESVSCRDVFLWSVSFFLLLLGLSGLSSVLFSDTAYYLSGGFVGGMLTHLFDNVLGLFGVLLFSAIFTAIGFYFCSGKVLIDLAIQLYDWIMQGSQEREKSSFYKNEEEHVNTNTSETVYAQEEQAQEPIQDESKFTDVSTFARPKITGLVVEREKTVEYEQDENQIVFDKPKSEVSLPRVSITESNNIRQQSSSVEVKEYNHYDVGEPYVPQKASIPRVRLEPDSEIDNNSDTDVKQKTTDIDNVESKTFSNKSPSFMQKMMPPHAPSELVEPILEEGEMEVGETQNVVKKTTYPKGYGKSLIHPLLEKKKHLAKPTTPLPTIDLLTTQPSDIPTITEREILDTSSRLTQELANFGVKATVEDVLIGPVVTRYEIQPAPGVKASKIMNLGNDLARALIFDAIRITEVVPGKPYMGIETPNRHRNTVWLKDVLASEEFSRSKAILPMALGKDISGKSVVVDMAKMPHLLVAGQTGGGKSVGINTMILSLLFKLSPDQVRFIMIDPKVVELSVYEDIPHLLTPVVTDMKKAENALRWAVEEMERRYVLVSRLSVRNIEGYNDKIRQADEMNLPIPNPLWKPGDTMDELPPPLEKLSYIVLVVDEFADLMMAAGKQVEDHIMRIAQKARAVGIHLILATQRPSTDVITGVIKANIPSRIAFTVASQIDSRTILDKGGAESLLGRGDMLYSAAGSPEILRVHGAFMTDADVQRVADDWRARGKPQYIESIVESNDENSTASEGVTSDLDPLFDEVVQYVIDTEITSISNIQRRFSVGFNRAARIVDQLTAQGILSEPDSKGKREILAR
ncbi:DNA translocase FtsK [Otariodibacter oris]|uniref:DNA translocase FtsK n=1 Tax=Otariodibacter oris TaxID=1032623 RepID=A0A420XJ36_9PAST|nr:DNA translocase FtsK [Otariodibacter oris]QGM80591.1 cell division protein FtsK [Otariodibacter oris]RKR77253.1 DNA translocase FtsK [Otariodibacter oris]